MISIIMTCFVDDIHQQADIYGWILLFDHAECYQHLYDNKDFVNIDMRTE